MRYLIFTLLFISFYLPESVFSQTIELVWSSSSDADTDYYVVYKDTSTHPMLEVAQVPATDTTYSDYEVEANKIYYYRVRSVDIAGNEGDFSDEVMILTSLITSEEQHESETPENFVLHQNYPNPFNLETRLSFYIAQNSEVSLVIYDLLGKQVKALVNETKQTGNYEVIWDGRNENLQTVSSGIYFARIVAGKFNHTIRLLLQK